MRKYSCAHSPVGSAQRPLAGNCPPPQQHMPRHLTGQDRSMFRSQQRDATIACEVASTTTLAIILCWMQFDSWAPVSTFCVNLTTVLSLLFLPRAAMNRPTTKSVLWRTICSWPSFSSGRKVSGATETEDSYLQSTASSFVFLDRFAMWHVKPAIMETIHNSSAGNLLLVMTVLCHAAWYYLRTSCPVEILTVLIAAYIPYMCSLELYSTLTYAFAVAFPAGLLHHIHHASGAEFSVAMFCVAMLVALIRLSNLIVARNMTVMLNDAKIAKDRFWSRMSHEFRNPLFAITASCDCLYETKLNREQKKLLGNLRTSSAILFALLDNLLSVARLKKGSWKLHWGTTALQQSIESVMDQAVEAASKRGLFLHVEVAPDIPDFVLADQAVLEEVLVSLLSNAIQYTERGKVIVRVYTVPASLHIAQVGVEIADGRSLTTDREITFSIEDTGIGIPSEELTNVFEPFFQIAQKGHNVGMQGAGVGLFLVKSLVHMWSGTVRVKSQEGVGSVFSFTMPCFISEPADLPSPTGTRRTSSASNPRQSSNESTRSLPSAHALNHVTLSPPSRRGSSALSSSSSSQSLSAEKDYSKCFDVMCGGQTESLRPCRSAPCSRQASGESGSLTEQLGSGSITDRLRSHPDCSDLLGDFASEGRSAFSPVDKPGAVGSRPAALSVDVRQRRLSNDRGRSLSAASILSAPRLEHIRQDSTAPLSAMWLRGDSVTSSTTAALESSAPSPFVTMSPSPDAKSPNVPRLSTHEALNTPSSAPASGSSYRNSFGVPEETDPRHKRYSGQREISPNVLRDVLLQAGRRRSVMRPLLPESLTEDPSPYGGGSQNSSPLEEVRRGPSSPVPPPIVPPTNSCMNSCESLLEHEEDASMRDISKKGKVKVLVADDQTMISKLLQRLTRACSDATVTVDCDCVEDGEDMVHYVKDCLDRSIDCPDVIVSDLHMLKMNGDAAITAVQKLCHERGVRAPYCVILSGDESRETFEAGERCGAHEVRIKPMKKEHLKEIIECAHLGRQTWKCT